MYRYPAATDAVPDVLGGVISLFRDRAGEVAGKEKRMSDRWEYHVETITPDATGATTLTRLGRDGWRVTHATLAGDSRYLAVILERGLERRGRSDPGHTTTRE